MLKGQIPKELFLEYKRKTKQGLNDYNRLIWIASLRYIQMLEKQFWRDGVLAELYGQIASKRDGIDYLQNWREGR